MFLANFRKEIREDGLGIARAGSDRRHRPRGGSITGESIGERKTFQEACFKWNLGRPSRATKRVLKFILGSGFTVLALGLSLSIVGFVISEANPFRIIGPVLAVYGFLILFLSFDVCMRLKASVPSEMESANPDGDGGKGSDAFRMDQKNGQDRFRHKPPSPVKLRSWGGDKMKGLIIGRNGELIVVKKQSSRTNLVDDDSYTAGSQLAPPREDWYPDDRQSWHQVASRAGAVHLWGQPDVPQPSDSLAMDRLDRSGHFW